jgi:hypothetical protein
MGGPRSTQFGHRDHHKQKLLALFHIGLLIARANELAMKSRLGFYTCATVSLVKSNLA